MDSKIRDIRNAYGHRFKLVRDKIEIGLSVLDSILKNIENVEDKRLYNNKLNKNKWRLRKLF